MNTKLLSLLVAVLSVTGFAVAVAVGGGTIHNSQEVQAYNIPATVYTGNITILPNGTVSLNGPGTPFNQSGNYYNLTGNVSATLTVQRPGAIVNGEGYFIFNNSYTAGPILNISQVNNVSVSNLQISSQSTAGIEVSNASHISLNYLNISTTLLGILVSSETYYVNVSNSIVALLPPILPPFNAFDIGMGITLSGFPPLPTGLSSHNSIYNDTLYSQDAYFGSVMLGSNYTSLVDTTITSSTALLGDVFDGANNTLIKGLILNASAAESAVLVEPASGGTITNNTFIDNTVTIWNPTSGTGSMNAVSFNSTGTVSGNKIMVNNAGGPAIGLFVQGKNIAVGNNKITLMHDSQGYSSTGIVAQGNNLEFTGNTLNLSGKNVSGISELSAGTTYSKVSENSIYINGTDFSQGIVLNGSSQNVNSNYIRMYTGPSNTGITGYAQAPANLSDLSVVDNSLFIDNGTSTGISLNASTAIQNALIKGNAVEFNSTTNFGKSMGMSLSSLNNSLVSMNTYGSNNGGALIGLNVSNSTNSTVTGNILNSGGEYGYQILRSNNITFSQNFVTGFMGAINFIDTGNSTFYGNTANGSINPFLVFGSDNLTIYHNNFINYAASPPAEIGGSKNILLNLSYPLGGNYWDSATSDKYSGPNQNIKGSDGINDTSFTPATGFIDYYPLVKPWTNPRAVFNETGLLPGSTWSVTFNGQTKTSSSNNIVFDIVNGTYQNYAYTVHTTNGYNGGGQSGTFQYTGNNSFTTSTTYIPKYVFNISETGLPTGTAWGVSINGTQHTITSSSYAVVANNGTSFTYRAYNTTLYYATPSSGSTTLAGSNVTVNVVYKHWAYIVADFNQTGINLTINGKSMGTDLVSFNETVPAGTYHVVISGNGYVTKYDNFTLSAGQSMNLSTTLSQVKSASSPSSLGPYVYVTVGVVAAAVIVSGAYFFLRRKS